MLWASGASSSLLRLWERLSAAAGGEKTALERSPPECGCGSMDSGPRRLGWNADTRGSAPE